MIYIYIYHFSLLGYEADGNLHYDIWFMCPITIIINF